MKHKTWIIEYPHIGIKEKNIVFRVVKLLSREVPMRYLMKTRLVPGH
jgi:hypothetical protein